MYNTTSLRVLPVTVFIVDYLHTSMAGYGNVAALVADVKADYRHLSISHSTVLSRVVLSERTSSPHWAPSGKIHFFEKVPALQFSMFWNILAVKRSARGLAEAQESHASYQRPRPKAGHAHGHTEHAHNLNWTSLVLNIGGRGAEKRGKMASLRCSNTHKRFLYMDRKGK